MANNSVLENEESSPSKALSLKVLAIGAGVVVLLAGGTVVYYRNEIFGSATVTSGDDSSQNGATFSTAQSPPNLINTSIESATDPLADDPILNGDDQSTQNLSNTSNGSAPGDDGNSSSPDQSTPNLSNTSFGSATVTSGDDSSRSGDSISSDQSNQNLTNTSFGSATGDDGDSSQNGDSISVDQSTPNLTNTDIGSATDPSSLNSISQSGSPVQSTASGQHSVTGLLTRKQKKKINYKKKKKLKGTDTDPSGDDPSLNGDSISPALSPPNLSNTGTGSATDTPGDDPSQNGASQSGSPTLSSTGIGSQSGSPVIDPAQSIGAVETAGASGPEVVVVATDSAAQSNGSILADRKQKKKILLNNFRISPKKLEAVKKLGEMKIGFRQKYSKDGKNLQLTFKSFEDCAQAYTHLWLNGYELAPKPETVIGNASDQFIHVLWGKKRKSFKSLLYDSETKLVREFVGTRQEVIDSSKEFISENPQYVSVLKIPV